ncbi:tyrosine-type recombinase/integrase [Lactobacillus xujianguonis]|uniref:tyrosine-type recombinase/integrase n=1 Tax=Lactobacillus xujianguonis TaxID=2495899 RepID=UPI000FD74768|nr:site-specific integrase [Lactobacillus xujianguonis]RVU72431.1 site-specific integrase [Lactobacillus xujianguonis]
MASITKRGKTWYVRFSKRVQQWNPEKQGMVSILKQKSKGGFKTKAEAQQFGIKMEAESLSGVDVTKNPEFAEYYRNWYTTYKFPSLSPSTKNRYKIDYKFIKGYFNTTKIKNISRDQYQSFITNFAKDHAIVTVRKLNTSIKACLSYAVDDGLLVRSFANHAAISGNENKERHVDYLNLQEIKQLVTSCEESLSPTYVSKYLIIAAIYTGARLGELSALQWSDVDFKNKTISITKSWNQDRRDMRKPKTKSSIRIIPVNSQLLDLLKQLKVNQSSFVFGKAITKLPPTSNGVNRVLRLLLNKNNMNRKNFHFHSLRHSHVAFLLSEGVDIYAISKRLGHADIGVTLKTYAYLLDEFKAKQDKVIVNALAKL